MRRITDKELLQLQLNILRDVNLFCRETGIEYFLVGGTAIGAIRHGGYIPWDDDIDIGMTRLNYNKFLQTFNGAYNNLKVFSPELDKNWYAPYANVCDIRTILYEGSNGHNGMEVGVKIDIFPYDAIPVNEKEFERKRSEVIRLLSIASIKRKILHNVTNKFSKSYLVAVVGKVLFFWVK